MDKTEAKDAFLAQRPVVHQGITYKKISALIYRIKSGAVSLSLELIDKNDNSVTIAAPEKVEIFRSN